MLTVHAESIQVRRERAQPAVDGTAAAAVDMNKPRHWTLAGNVVFDVAERTFVTITVQAVDSKVHEYTRISIFTRGRPHHNPYNRHRHTQRGD